MYTQKQFNMGAVKVYLSINKLQLKILFPSKIHLFQEFKFLMLVEQRLQCE